MGFFIRYFVVFSIYYGLLSRTGKYERPPRISTRMTPSIPRVGAQRHITETMKHKTSVLLAGIAAFLLFAGCQSHTTQTTSGQDYLSRYPTPMGGGSSSIDEEVKDVANIEPTLRFPARIGLAKLFNGRIVNLSVEEVEAWDNLRTDLGSDFGEFLPVSALIAESVYKAPANPAASFAPQEIFRKIRLGAARQHLDVVLIYEVFSKTKSTTLASSVADWTIIGAYFIPSKSIQTTGYANCLLMDIRTGYPYGTASATLNDKELSATFTSYDKQGNLADLNQIATALKLVPEAKQMMLELMEALKSKTAN